MMDDSKEIEPSEEKEQDESSKEEGVAVEADDNSGENENKILLPINPKFKWYIVSTYSGSEETVKQQLLERIKKLKLEEDFGEIFIPKTVVEKILKSGEKKEIHKTSYPGYIIIQMKLTDQSMACVASVQKVAGFVGNRKSPKPMKDEEILSMINLESQKKKVKKATITFEKGESVKVIDGPFNNFDGIIEEIRPEKMKVKVLVCIFGRETPVELAYSQVKKIS